ncbi:MAG: PAS domain S-box protein [Bacteroidetes bacterium]|nr:PAS domain S-box protein [Bacteroidota bacterium]
MIGKPRLFSRKLMVFFAVVLSMLIIVAVTIYYQHEAKTLRSEKEQDLVDVTNLKTNQLISWKNERISDARVIASRRFLKERIMQWINDRDNPELLEPIIEDLKLPKDEYNYEAIFLASPEGELFHGTGSNLDSFGEVTQKMITGVAEQGVIMSTDFYFCREGQSIHYDVLAPLTDKSGKVFAVLVMRMQPETFIFPLMQSWPSKSITAETFIIRQDGDSVVFLNDLRHKPGSALNLKASLSDNDLPAVKAVKGQEGFVEGLDYRGEKVLAFIKRVPETPWYMIAKYDVSEIYGPLHKKMPGILIFVILSVSLVIMSVSWIYRNRQANIYKSLWLSQEEFRIILDNIGDGVMATDTKGRIQYLNPIAEDLTGWVQKHARSKNILEVFNIINEETRTRVENPVDRVIQEGVIIGLANHTLLVRKDGTEIPIADSGAPIKDEKGEIIGAVLVFRDQSEDRKIQKEIRQSEEKFAMAFKSSPYAITITRPSDGKIIEVNEEFFNITGYTRKEIIGFTTIDLQLWVNEEDRKYVVNEMLQGRMVSGKEFLFRKKSGEQLTGLYSSGIISIGTEKYILSSINDITSRKKSEIIQEMQYKIAHSLVTARTLNELYEVARHELSALLDTRNVFIAFYKEDTNMLFSPFEYDEKGEDPQSWPVEKSLTGKVITEKRSILLSKEEILALSRKKEINLYGARAEQWLGVPLIIEGRVIGAIVLQSYDNPAAYNQSSVEVLEIIASQLSLYIERKKSEESAIKLSKAVTQSPVSVVITDINGNIEYVNPKFTELTGYGLEEVLGKNPSILKSGKQTQEFYKNLWDTILSGKEWVGEFLNKRKNGDLFWEQASISPIFNDEGVITHFVSLKEDITEKKKMIGDLIEARDKAEAANRLKTAFLNNISHEIRTPLNGIMGFADLISKEDITGDEKSAFLNLLRASSDRLLNTINDYMDISLLTSGSMVVNKKTFGIQNLIMRLMDQFVSKCNAKNLELIIDLPKESKWMIFSDEELLRKAMAHLVDNAVKFTRKGSVTLGYKISDKNFEIFVKDTGPGIKADMKKMVFEMFIQTDSSTTRGYEGSGLGLSIVKGIAELLGGNVQLESEEGRGTAVNLVLTGIEIRKETGESSVKTSSVQDKKRILIVEDEPSNSLYLETVMARAGIQTISAENGQEAVEICKKHPDIALVFMDLKMPLMDGFRATRMIKDIRPELPVIAITAYAMSGDESRARDAGCDDYLSKPVRKELLFRKLEEYKVLE